jgi:sec-independent protein translocase protein TatB
MFGLGFGEIVIIAILALLVLGPDRLPGAAKTVGKTLRDLRRATDDIKGQIETEIYADDRKAAKPALVPPVPAQAARPAGPPPPASVENVPGLEAALAEAGAAEPPPAAAPAAAPAGAGAAPGATTA